MWIKWVPSLLVVTLVTGVTSAKSPLVAANNAFSVRLYKRVVDVLDDENAFLSPFSVATTLAMTSTGAKGKTASEISKVLGFEKHPISDVSGAFKQALDKLKTSNNENFTATLAHRLFLDKRFKLLSEFVKVATENYATTPMSLDFAGAADESRRYINKWAADATEQKIKNLLTPTDITPKRGLLLANANYLKGSWQNPFDKSKTRKRLFHVSGDLTVNVTMMEITGKFRFSLNYSTGSQFVELPYVGTKLSMLLIVPPINSLTLFESNLNGSELISGIDHLDLLTVTVQMPKFNITQRFDLVQTLSNMGIHDLFTQRADLSGLAEDSAGGLSAFAVAHKSYISVDEQGSDSAVPRPANKTYPENIHVIADKPFMFIIRDVETGRYVSMGRYIKPSSDDDKVDSPSKAGHVHPAAVAWLVALAVLLLPVTGHAL